MSLIEFSNRLKARVSAWYLTHDRDYSCCGTCGYDNTKPSVEDVYRLIDEELKAAGQGFQEVKS